MGKSSGLLQTRTQPVVNLYYVTCSISGKTLGLCKNLGFFNPVRTRTKPLLKPVLNTFCVGVRPRFHWIFRRFERDLWRGIGRKHITFWQFDGVSLLDLFGSFYRVQKKHSVYQVNQDAKNSHQANGLHQSRQANNPEDFETWFAARRRVIYHNIYYIYMLYIYVIYIYIYMLYIYRYMLYIYVIYIYRYMLYIYIYVIYMLYIYIDICYIYVIYMLDIYIYICIYIYVIYIYMLYICYIYVIYIYVYICYIILNYYLSNFSHSKISHTNNYNNSSIFFGCIPIAWVLKTDEIRHLD